MSTAKRLSATLAGSLLFSLFSQASAQQVLPTLTTPAAVEISEGDTGSTLVELTFILDRAALADVSFQVSLDWHAWNALPDADYAQWPDYEYIAAACPTCAWSESARVDVGTLVRRFSEGTLDRIDIDAVWQDGNPPYWLPPQSALASSDLVQLLGGPGTTQGCAP